MLHCITLRSGFAVQVRELERRKAEDAQRREQQAAQAAEKARVEAERTAKTKWVPLESVCFFGAIKLNSSHRSVWQMLVGSSPSLHPFTHRRAERDAATARLSAVVPELEALEASWARLHGICGAATAEDVIAYWQGETRQLRDRQLGAAAKGHGCGVQSLQPATPAACITSDPLALHASTPAFLHYASCRAEGQGSQHAGVGAPG